MVPLTEECSGADVSVVLARVKENDFDDWKRSLEIHDHPIPIAVPILVSISVTRKMSEGFRFFFNAAEGRKHAS